MGHKTKTMSRRMKCCGDCSGLKPHITPSINALLIEKRAAHPECLSDGLLCRFQQFICSRGLFLASPRASRTPPRSRRRLAVISTCADLWRSQSRRSHDFYLPCAAMSAALFCRPDKLGPWEFISPGRLRLKDRLPFCACWDITSVPVSSPGVSLIRCNASF